MSPILAEICLVFFSAALVRIGVLAHAILDVVVEDEVEFRVAEAVVPRQHP